MNVWERGAIKGAERLCLEYSADGISGYEFLHDIRNKLKSGFYSEEMVDFVFQAPCNARRWGGHEPSIEDAYCFISVWDHMLSGELCFFHVEVGDEPFADSARQRNAEVLSSLEPLFTATVYNGLCDSDGWFKWNDEIVGITTVIRDNKQVASKHTLCPRSVPLEIGTTRAPRTLAHLRSEGGLARWPYGSTDLIVGVMVKDPRRLK